MRQKEKTIERRERILAYLAWASVCFFWGTTYLAIKIGVSDLPPALFAGTRFLIAGVLFFTLIRPFGHGVPSMRYWPDLAVCGVFMLGVCNGLVVFAGQYIASGMSALVITTTPLWVVLANAVMPPRQPIHARTVLGILCGTAGVWFIFREDMSGGRLDSDSVTGIVSVMIGSFSWAFGAVYSQRRNIPVHPLPAAAFQTFVAGMFLTTIGLAAGEAARFHFTYPALMAYLYLIVFGSIVGYGSFVYALSRLPASFVTTYTYINPVVALTLGWAVLGETIGQDIAVAALLILCGVGLIRTPPPQTSRGEQTAHLNSR